MRRYAAASTLHYTKKLGTKKKYVQHINSFLDNPLKLQQNPPSSKVFMSKKFKRHISDFIKENYTPKTVDEVLLIEA